MRANRRPLILFLLACLGLLISSGTALADYVFTPIDPPGAEQTHATGINNNGNIVGWYQDGSGTHGFLDVNGSFTTLDVPGSFSTYALGINNQGLIVGGYQVAVQLDPFSTAFIFHGFIYDGSTYQTLDSTVTPETILNGINDSGVITGQDAGCCGGSFIYDGSFHLISVPGSLFTEAGGINNAGQVTGFYRAPGPGFHGFVYTAGSFQLFDVPGGFDTEPTDINNDGVVVGWTLSPFAGFIAANGSITEFDYPGNPGNFAFGINDHGQIVGAFSDPSEPFLHRGFLATPVPEAGTLLLLAAGLVCSGLVRLRRRHS